MTADEYCRQMAGASGSSLHYSLLFLPAPRRRAVVALHAYWQQLREAADGTSDPSVAGAQLAWWHDEVDRLVAGTPQHPVTQALASHRDIAGITRQGMLQVLDGMRMVVGPARFADAAALARHCRLAAGSIAEMTVGLCGMREPATADYARALGEGLQIVHILRELGEDARRGRIRLPLDDLQRFGVAPADILAGRYVDGFLPLMRREAQRARDAFAEAARLLPPAESRAQQPGRIMAAIHAALLDELERDGFRVLHQRVALTPLRKLAIAWRTRMFPQTRTH